MEYTPVSNEFLAKYAISPQVRRAALDPNYRAVPRYPEGSLEAYKQENERKRALVTVSDEGESE